MKIPRSYFPWLLLFALITCFAFSAESADTLRITNTTWTPGGFQFGWTNLGPGTSYTIQSREQVVDGLWLAPEASQPWPTTLNYWTDSSALSNQFRFYRVLGVPTAERGKLLNSTTRGTLDLITLAYLYSIGALPVPPQYAVTVYKLNYETISPLGGRTKASGTLMLPSGVSGSWPLVSYQHGTITRTNDAPSISTNSDELIIGIAFATTGYAAVLPDYLGLGESEGVQAYLHARSEATACVDMLRAARRYCASNSVALNGKLFLCGYSQGGHATMALFRELETYHTGEFTVTACAPMAGPYDMSGVTTDDALSGRLVPNPYYYALLLAAFQDVYDLAPTLADLLIPPYTTNLPPLLQGNSMSRDINNAMTNPPLQILKADYLAAFRTNALHPLRVALRDNDLYGWTPRAPMQMFHCGGDQDVLIANSQVAFTNFLARGATQVQLIIPSATADHGDCVYPSLTAAKAWFDSLK